MHVAFGRKTSNIHEYIECAKHCFPTSIYTNDDSVNLKICIPMALLKCNLFLINLKFLRVNNETIHLTMIP
jgi:hypothetical protein